MILNGRQRVSAPVTYEQASLFFDHFAITCNITIHQTKPERVRERICYRGINSFGLKGFRLDICKLSLYSKYEQLNVSQLVHKCDQYLRHGIDQYMPLVLRQTSIHKKALWYKLRPRMYSDLTHPIGQLLGLLLLLYHCYTENIQLNRQLLYRKPYSKVENIIDSWFTDKKLKLKPAKTKFVILSRIQHLLRICFNSLPVHSSTVPMAYTAKPQA